ncbi:BglG family transcription antiterminator [Peptacetobacter sp. AB800]|uniref:BglG family transcription antiterminator n=1 Tax=Peptacetobacter sp. AB800 TaxID=3388428 RepID=UPI0039FDD10F
MSCFYEENRLARILNIMEQKQSVTVDYLSEKMDVSSKTIKNDIKEINNSLKGHAIIENKNNSYILYIFDISQYEQLKNEVYMHDDFMNSPNSRTVFIMQKLMNTDCPYLTDELAYDMNIGRTTVNGDLKKLRKMLEGYNIQIEGKTNTGISLKGNELDIRFFILENMYEGIYKKYPIDLDLIDAIKEIALKYELDSVSVEYFIKFFTIMIDRFLKGNPIVKLDEKYMELKENSSYIFAKEISEKISKILMTDLPEEEILFISIPIAGMRTPTNAKTIEMLNIKKDTEELISKIKDIIKQEMNINIYSEQVMQEFMYHIKFMINRMKYGFKIRGIDTEEIKNSNSVAYAVAELAADVIEKEEKVDISKEEIALMSVYFGIMIDKSNLEKNKIYSIAIICGTGRISARVVESNLKKIIKNETVMDIYSDSKINSEILNSYDLVISTVKLDIDTDTEIIYIKDVLDKSELKRKIELLKYSDKKEISVIKGMNSIMLSRLDENRFFVLDKSYSYSENVNMMIDILENEGHLDSGFKERIREREEKSSMIFEDTVAFPHTINYASDNIELALGVVPENMVDEKGKYIKLVFLLGLPEDDGDDTILVRIYDEIIKIASDKKLVNEISKIDNYKDLLMYFVKSSDLFD